MYYNNSLITVKAGVKITMAMTKIKARCFNICVQVIERWRGQTHYSLATKILGTVLHDMADLIVFSIHLIFLMLQIQQDLRQLQD